MSCSVCRLPFVPGPGSTNPRPIPSGVLTDRQYKYFAYGIGIATQIFGVVSPVEYFDSNMFGLSGNVLVPQILQWESHGGTFVMLHTVCSALLRRALNAEDETVESMTDLVELDRILGRPQAEANAGRFRHVDYENVRCSKLGRVDLAPFWLPGNEPGENMFDFRALKASNLAILLNRPDTFPKFFTTVNPDRLKGLEDVPETKDTVTNLPTDILEALISHFTTPTYICFTSTCRLLRRQALTSWQTFARDRVLELAWAVPVQSEYALGKKHNIIMVSEEDSPVDADWMLYLSHVHRTQSMNVREWIWGLCQEIKRVRDELKPKSDMADVDVGGQQRKSQARLDVETQVTQMSSIAMLSRIRQKYGSRR